MPDQIWPELSDRLLDIQNRRIREMDENCVEMMLLFFNSTVVHAVSDTAKAADLVRRANDYLAEEVANRPDRFQGFAALAMQDPDGAIRELVFPTGVGVFLFIYCHSTYHV
jgi:2,3-dihydroxybenzoate decarboxylase